MTFVQHDYAETPEYKTVSEVSDRLLDHLNEPEAQGLLAAANAPGQSSALVQASFEVFAAELGFTSEAKGFFGNYDNKAVRPDYFLPLDESGILMEVERGKSTINNMDFLDFWKCHLCEHADYLFLMVPQELRQNLTMSPRREYNTVVKRMGSFFMPRNYTNVRGLHVFGY
jgi:hypothetical protein